MPLIEVEIGEFLRRKGLTLGTVESATGGLISHRITNVPGSSDYYQGSVITYSNEAKIQVVGVKEQTITKHGAVSASVAREMAEGGRKLLKVDLCLSDTGIAGPAGATDQKPVGLFYLGLSSKEKTVSRRQVFQGSREANKQSAAEAALRMLKAHLLRMPQGGKPLEERHVVTCFLESEGQVLILQRSGKVGTYRGRWAGVSGYLDMDDPEEQAWTEIAEETGLGREGLRLVSRGEVLEAIDEGLGKRWVVHPYLFQVYDRNKVRIDWEHQQCRWVQPQDLVKYETVPLLQEALARVYPR